MRLHLHTSCPAILFIISLAVAAVGCGGSDVTIRPNFNRPELQRPELKREQVCFVKVVDNRPDTSSRIGSASVGMFNKSVPYYMTGKLSDNVRTMLDSLVGGACARDRRIPVTVAIDTFEVGEKTTLFSEVGYFRGTLRFMYPVTQDSIASFSISSRQTAGGMDATDGIEPLIYRGMAECAQLFVERALDKSPGLALSADSVPAMSGSVSAVAPPTTPARTPVIRKEEVIRADASSDTRNELSFHYSKGGRITSGLRGTFSILNEEKDSDLRWGIGISFTHLDIENTADLLAGSFFNFSTRLTGKYFFGKRTSLYVGGGLGFAGGTEKLTLGHNSEEESFFFGPNVEEVIGIALNRKLFLEFGSYQLVYFGSKLLPSDIGITAGVSLGL